MMLPSHVLIGVLIGTTVATVFPAYLNYLLVIGGIGSILPDIDMLFGEHRQTLHFPVYYIIAAIVGVIGTLTIHPLFIAAAVFFSSAGVHCLMDILGGGKELRPWEKTDDRAVYNHVTGNWLQARRLFYAGSTTDLAVCLFITVLLLFRITGVYRVIALLMAGAGLTVTVLLPYIARWIPDEYNTFSSFIRIYMRRSL
jgi:hypothetical protein